MNIIANDGGLVNITITNSFGVEMEQTPTRSKWEQKKLRAKIIAAKLEAIGEKKRSERMAMCSTYITANECPSCGHMHVLHTKLCRDRLCPICQWRLSMRRFATMYTIVDGLQHAYPESQWQFVTLTLRNCRAEDLSATIDLMSSTWNKIASNTTFKEFYQGWAKSLEITYNPRTRTLHPHYHILLMQRTHFGGKYVQRSWCRLLHNQTSALAQCTETIDMQAGDEINKDAILETYKYAFKSDEAEDMPLSIFRHLVKAIKGRRLVAYGGKVKEYAQLCQLPPIDNPSEDDEAEAAALINKCVKCGRVGLIQTVGMWNRNGYIWREVEG
jgi:plasmid rolling circle replication initiator protein Rep